MFQRRKDAFNKKMMNLFSGLCETSLTEIEKPVIPYFGVRAKKRLDGGGGFKPITIRKYNSAPLKKL
jgi:hypothetical protein